MPKRDLAKDLFISYKTGYIKKPLVGRNISVREVNLNPTDPQLISDVLKNLIQDRDWQSGIAEEMEIYLQIGKILLELKSPSTQNQ